MKSAPDLPVHGSPPLISVRGLSVHSASGPLVTGVDLDIAEGERVGIIGSSGSGKTLTCLAIAGLLPAGLSATGVVTLAGATGNLLTAREGILADLRGRRIGMVFQEPMTALNPTMRIGAQVAEVLLIHRTARRAQVQDTVHRLLADTGLPDPPRVARAYPHQLSGGQRQRVLLAIAVANSPDVLICDEPTTALDVTVQARVLELIDRKTAEHSSALLFVSHNLAVVAQLCERVIVMYRGKIVEIGSALAVLTAPRHHHTRELLADAELSAT